MVLVLEAEKAKMIESDLREWLKKNWLGPKGSLEWVEHGLGGTAGLPDCNLLCGESYPVELKMAHRMASGGYRVEIRPVQIRYHVLAARNGRKTAFLFGVEKENGMSVYLMPGSYCPLDGKLPTKPNWVRIASSQSIPFRASRKSYQALRDAVDSRMFWSHGGKPTTHSLG